MKIILLTFLLIAVTTAELSDNCKYVAEKFVLNEIDKVESCFNTFTLHQDVIDTIVKNLDLVHDFYPYVEIASNPPKEPPNYFKAFNFTKELEVLKMTLNQSDRVISKVVRPVVRLVSGLRDGHFGVQFIAPLNESYDNIFSDVRFSFPFKWDVETEGNERIVHISKPDKRFLSEDDCALINELNEQGHSVKYIETSSGSKDAFEFFISHLGEFNGMKSPQGSIALVRNNPITSLLLYPVEDIFDEFTAVFDDDNATEIKFKRSLFNYKNRASNARDIDTPRDPIQFLTTKQMTENKKILQNFKKRSVRSPHTIIQCGNMNGMNYMQITSFGYSDAAYDQFVQEFLECTSDFDKNDDPITIVLPNNGGGDSSLALTIFYVLMPWTDMRVIDAIRKPKLDKVKQVCYEVALGYSWSANNETCIRMNDVAEAEEYFKQSEFDDFGAGAVHERTRKSHEGWSSLSKFASSRMKNLRKPTDVIIATDGFCFSTCSLFVGNIIQSGAAIVAGYGITHPGDDKFTASQCPSGVLDLGSSFKELSNSKYGLSVSATVIESYQLSRDLKEKTPLDYVIFRVDTHTGYYKDYKGTTSDLEDLLDKTKSVYETFNTTCNPDNKRLLYVTDKCKSTKSHVKRSGYVCGSDKKWDTTTCKISSCEEGYVVDFDNDECIPDSCYPEVIPSSSSHSTAPSQPSAPSQPAAPSQPVSSSTISKPVIELICVFIIAFFHIFF